MRSDAPEPVRVLVVDDDDLFAQTIAHLVSSEEDFEVIGRAGDGREGVELALAHAPDLIVMDVQMPVMDGLEATSRLRRLGVDADVLLVSGEDVSAHFQETEAVGAAGYLPKSEVVTELVPTLRAIAAARRTRLDPGPCTA
jgi:DNA-binding NarL/FixJ family response regulator